jgi:ribose 5-phosphate isomerase B
LLIILLMRNQKVIIGSDHGGFAMKQELSCFLAENGYEVSDIGAFSCASVDYPDIAQELCSALINSSGAKGMLICGSGIGMSIAANKVQGIRAALCSEPLSAKLSREHNDANILCMGARLIGIEMAKNIALIFLETAFMGDRHHRRLQKITMIEEKK